MSGALLPPFGCVWLDASCFHLVRSICIRLDVCGEHRGQGTGGGGQSDALFVGERRDHDPYCCGGRESGCRRGGTGGGRDWRGQGEERWWNKAPPRAATLFRPIPNTTGMSSQQCSHASTRTFANTEERGLGNGPALSYSCNPRNPALRRKQLRQGRALPFVRVAPASSFLCLIFSGFLGFFFLSSYFFIFLNFFNFLTFLPIFFLSFLLPIFFLFFFFFLSPLLIPLLLPFSFSLFFF